MAFLTESVADAFAVNTRDKRSRWRGADASLLLAVGSTAVAEDRTDGGVSLCCTHKMQVQIWNQRALAVTGHVGRSQTFVRGAASRIAQHSTFARIAHLLWCQSFIQRAFFNVSSNPPRVSSNSAA